RQSGLVDYCWDTCLSPLLFGDVLYWTMTINGEVHRSIVATTMRCDSYLNYLVDDKVHSKTAAGVYCRRQWPLSAIFRGLLRWQCSITCSIVQGICRFRSHTQPPLDLLQARKLTTQDFTSWGSIFHRG
ncbi:unnamed protein product, partial [Sphacelaria rigidula]